MHTHARARMYVLPSRNACMMLMRARTLASLAGDVHVCVRPDVHCRCPMHMPFIPIPLTAQPKAFALLRAHAPLQPHTHTPPALPLRQVPSPVCAYARLQPHPYADAPCLAPAVLPPPCRRLPPCPCARFPHVCAHACLQPQTHTPPALPLLCVRARVPPVGSCRRGPAP